MKNPRLLALFVLGLCSVPASTFAATSSELREPPVFASSNHVLDVLIIARPREIELGEFLPTAWVYEVCYRKNAVGDACPSGHGTAAEYGGMRLQLEPGDHLKIRLVNQLPPAPPDADHLSDPMGAMLLANPTNLHTHGLIVEPRQPSATNHTYGDYVYVYAYPRGKLPSMTMPGIDMTEHPIDYDIYIPRDHPSGSFWIHPHVHGLALNQVSSGLAGIITIGGVNDYLSAPASPFDRDPMADINVRHLVLKDIQVLADGKVFSQEEPEFCAPDPVDEPLREGFCPGQSFTDDDGVHSYIGGKWFFTINGQIHPTIRAGSKGEIWRITQASGSRTYQLSLVDDVSHKALVFQVLALDGVTLTSANGMEATARSTGGKVNPVPCPATLRGVPNAVCANGMHLMPSSRAEIWIPPMHRHTSAELMTHSYNTGPAGDDWPSAGLAHIEFPAGTVNDSAALGVKITPRRLLDPAGLLNSDVKIDGGPSTGEITLQTAPAEAAKLPPGNRSSLEEHLRALTAPESIPSVPCTMLGSGHHRRIFFGLPAGNPDAFGLGYEEVNRLGKPIPTTFQDITPFDHSVINVCLPLSTGNKTATEVWELVNVSGEDHNFHIHQTKFQVLSKLDGIEKADALMDNVPVLHGGNGCDGSVSGWRSGACQVKPVYVRIPFSEVGDFVYHCHILEHEDGGMMAHIRVVPAK